MDPRNDQEDEVAKSIEPETTPELIDQEAEVVEPVEPEEMQPEPTDEGAPAAGPAPVIPEIVPAETPLQGETVTADFSTVGTGTVFAISCSALAILFVVVCVGFFILFRVF